MWTRLLCETLADEHDAVPPAEEDNDWVEVPPQQDEKDTPSSPSDTGEASVWPVVSFLVKMREPRKYTKSVAGHKRAQIPPLSVPDLEFALAYQDRRRPNYALAENCQHTEKCYSFERKPPSKQVPGTGCSGTLSTAVPGFDVVNDRGYLRLIDFAVTSRSRAMDPPVSGEIYALRKMGDGGGTVKRLRDLQKSLLSKMERHKAKQGVKLKTCVAAVEGPVILPLWYKGTYAVDADSDNEYLIKGYDTEKKIEVTLDGTSFSTGKNPTFGNITNHGAVWMDLFRDVEAWRGQSGELKFWVGAEAAKWEHYAGPGRGPPREFRINRYFMGELVGMWECGHELSWNYGMEYWAAALFGVETLEDADQKLRIQENEATDWIMKPSPYFFNNLARIMFVCEAVCYFDARDEFLGELLSLQKQRSLDHAGPSRRGTPRVRITKDVPLLPLVMDQHTFPALFDPANFDTDAAPSFSGVANKLKLELSELQHEFETLQWAGTEAREASTNLCASFPTVQEFVDNWREFTEQQLPDLEEHLGDAQPLKRRIAEWMRKVNEDTETEINRRIEAAMSDVPFIRDEEARLAYRRALVGQMKREINDLPENFSLSLDSFPETDMSDDTRSELHNNAVTLRRLCVRRALFVPPLVFHWANPEDEKSYSEKYFAWQFGHPGSPVEFCHLPAIFRGEECVLRGEVYPFEEDEE